MSGAEETLARIVAVHARYFDMDGKPGRDDTDPEPEDVWRYDRDFRAALATPAPCPVCGGAGIVDTSPPGVEHTAPWLQTDTDCPRCDGTGEMPDTDTEEH